MCTSSPSRSVRSELHWSSRPDLDDLPGHRIALEQVWHLVTTHGPDWQCGQRGRVRDRTILTASFDPSKFDYLLLGLGAGSGQYRTWAWGPVVSAAVSYRVIHLVCKARGRLARSARGRTSYPLQHWVPRGFREILGDDADRRLTEAERRSPSGRAVDLTTCSRTWPHRRQAASARQPNRRIDRAITLLPDYR